MTWLRTLGLYSLRRRRLISIGIPIINLRRSSDRLRFFMGIPIPVRRRLLSGPDLQEFPVVAAGTALIWQVILHRLYTKANHLLQKGLTLVVYQCLMGTFDSIMVDFLIGHYNYRTFPSVIPPTSLWWASFLLQWYSRRKYEDWGTLWVHRRKWPINFLFVYLPLE